MVRRESRSKIRIDEGVAKRRDVGALGGSVSDMCGSSKNTDKCGFTACVLFYIRSKHCGLGFSDSCNSVESKHDLKSE